jgi:hypothetical protein
MWNLADKYRNYTTPGKTARELLPRLAKYKPFIFKESKDRRSVYIHFNALPNGMTHKLRVSDHEERERYGYKWQLRLDGLPHRMKPQRRYFDNADELVRSFEKYYDRVISLNEELLKGKPCPDCGAVGLDAHSALCLGVEDDEIKSAFQAEVVV